MKAFIFILYIQYAFAMPTTPPIEKNNSDTLQVPLLSSSNDPIIFDYSELSRDIETSTYDIDLDFLESSGDKQPSKQFSPMKASMSASDVSTQIDVVNEQNTNQIVDTKKANAGHIDDDITKNTAITVDENAKQIESTLATTSKVEPSYMSLFVTQTPADAAADIVKGYTESNISHDMNNSTAMLMQLCLDFLQNNETCVRLYEMCRNENYLKLTWEITNRVFFQRPFGVVLFLLWTIMLCVLNFVILFACTLLKPLRSFFLTKIISDLRRRYYFTNDSSELRIVDNNVKK